MEYMYEKIKRLCEINGVLIDNVMSECSDGEFNYQTLWGWKRRGNFPRADFLYKVAKRFGVPMESFFDNSKELQLIETRESEVISLFKNLSLDSQDQILSLLKTLQGK